MHMPTMLSRLWFSLWYGCLIWVWRLTMLGWLAIVLVFRRVLLLLDSDLVLRDAVVW